MVRSLGLSLWSARHLFTLSFEPAKTNRAIHRPGTRILDAKGGFMNFREALYVLFRWLGTSTRSSASPRAQVTALLEKHTTENPDGNVAIVAVDKDGGDDGGGEGTGATIIRQRRLRNVSERIVARQQIASSGNVSSSSSLGSTTAGRNNDDGGKGTAE